MWKDGAGFSLIEIMVVLALIGVLVTFALPRYEVFMAKSRQAEARINLGVLYSLQQSYFLKHGIYFGGYCSKEVTVTDSEGNTSIETRECESTDSLGSPGVTFSMTHAENAYGLTDSGIMRCYTNDLGFQVAGCSVSQSAVRYGYFLTANSRTSFQAIAFACSCTDKTRIFPGCDGAGVARGAGNSYVRPPGLRDKQCTVASRDEADTTFAKGDAWCLDHNRRVENYRDIVEFCS